FLLKRGGGSLDLDCMILLQHVLGGGVVLLALASMFLGGRMKRWRYVLQVSSVLILGFWSGYFVSLELLFNWLLNGIPWGARVLLPVIAVLALACPLFLGKAFYCAYLCPFGAAQELMGKIYKKKKFPKGVWKHVFKYTRVVYFAGILVLLLWGFPLDLASLEPFSAFLLTAATGWVIALAVVFLLLSIFFARPWCNYFCPTGAFLDLLRKEGKVEPENRKKVFGEFAALAIFLLILYFILR
ncbi:MAG: 4Fe-4S binding protein, partial [Odoribacter sp.]|nr:4Fe-4S binding protein [Odoribacter sp.]